MQVRARLEDSNLGRLALAELMRSLDVVPERYRALVVLATFAGRQAVAFAPEIAPELRAHLEQFAGPSARGLVFVGPLGGRRGIGHANDQCVSAYTGFRSVQR